MEIHNLTATDVTIVNEGKLIAVYTKEGEATCQRTLVREGVVDGTIVFSEQYRDVVGLPDYDPTKLYIVSQQVAEAVRDARTDILVAIEPIIDPKYGEVYNALLQI